VITVGAGIAAIWAMVARYLGRHYEQTHVEATVSESVEQASGR
jgi:hypothetical protein